MNDLSGAQVGTQRKSHQTQPKASILTGRSEFPMSYKFPTTMRYGHISPFYYQHGKGDDVIPLFSEHLLRTHTMASPVDTDVQMQKTYFSVPMDAFYPLQWERIQVNPEEGDDVPDDTRCCFDLVKYLHGLKQRIDTFLSNSTMEFTNENFKLMLDSVLLLESVFSNGSLFANFNIHLSPLVKIYVDDRVSSLSFDDWLDMFYPSLFRAISDSSDYPVIFNIDGVDYSCTGSIVGDSYSYNGVRYVNIHQLLDMLRSESYSVEFTGNFMPKSFVLNNDDFTDLRSVSIMTSTFTPINLEVIIAYQMGCFQYFSDSHIDDIFDASRFRSLFNSLLHNFFKNYTQISYPSVFSYNGQSLFYDVFSAKHFESLLYHFLPGASISLDTEAGFSLFNIFKLLFSFRNSLRFGDYFITARLKQLGVGNVNIDTSSGSVSVIDITKKIQLQRFLQAVSWSPQKAKDYIRDVLGVKKTQTPKKDVPMFIASDRFDIKGYEVENTGSEQRDVNSITTLVKTERGKFAFEFHPENQCIVIGVIHFDAERIYSKTLDRNHTHANRYDDFIPQMQFTGDQEIKKRELDTSLPDGVFGWTLRYMPMKIRINYAAGAFVNHLKSWMFITDNKDGNTATDSIDSRYLRSTPAEFDRFYTSLTGCSLATYYHFMVVNKNYQNLVRDMVYAPEPLK